MTNPLIAPGTALEKAMDPLLLMLVGELPMSKPVLEKALREALDARNAWANAIKELTP
jgi:hypothetical protein